MDKETKKQIDKVDQWILVWGGILLALILVVLLTGCGEPQVELKYQPVPTVTAPFTATPKGAVRTPNPMAAATMKQKIDIDPENQRSSLELILTKLGWRNEGGNNARTFRASMYGSTVEVLYDGQDHPVFGELKFQFAQPVSEDYPEIMGYTTGVLMVAVMPDITQQQADLVYLSTQKDKVYSVTYGDVQIGMNTADLQNLSFFIKRGA